MVIIHDLLWKYVLEGRFDEFLRFFFRQHCDKIDFGKGFEFLDKELQQIFPESEGGNRHVDKLVRVWLTDGTERWILIHIEVQGWQDKDFAKRMYQYHYRIYDRYGVEVTSIALPTDASKSWKPDSFGYKFMGTTLHFGFNLFKLAGKNRARLLASGNEFGFILAAILDSMGKAESDEGKLKKKISIIRPMLKQGCDLKGMHDIVLFVRLAWKFADEKYYRIFDKKMDMLTNTVKPKTLEEAIIQRYQEHFYAEGVAKGIEKGRAEGRAETLVERDKQHAKNMLLKGFDKKTIAEVLDTQPTLHEKVAKEMFDKKELGLSDLFQCGYSVADLGEILKIGQESLAAAYDDWAKPGLAPPFN